MNRLINFDGIRPYIIGVCSDLKIRIWSREDNACIYDQDIPLESQDLLQGLYTVEMQITTLSIVFFH
jgi:hypothetical protein